MEILSCVGSCFNKFMALTSSLAGIPKACCMIMFDCPANARPILIVRNSFFWRPVISPISTVPPLLPVRFVIAVFFLRLAISWSFTFWVVRFLGALGGLILCSTLFAELEILLPKLEKKLADAIPDVIKHIVNAATKTDFFIRTTPWYLYNC